MEILADLDRGLAYSQPPESTNLVLEIWAIELNFLRVDYGKVYSDFVILV